MYDDPGRISPGVVAVYAPGVLRVGLTGGIGSGKTSVARLLAEHGASVVDSDAIAREVVEPGTPGLAAVLEAFGPGVLRADGTLDRGALAARVFADETDRERLNVIVHPLVAARAVELAQAAEAADPQGVLVQDVPLLVENSLAAGFDVVLVVEAPVELRLERLAARGMDEQEAVRRMATQAGDEARRAVATAVIVNDGDLQALAAAVDEVWRETITPHLASG
ncbi:MAG: dephospho-CoA kinase [Frankiaceae bacterium]|nr:dephospho-CoA kinase [Frankiaceae bacterium]MDX6224588.1 dephospho-CoA kinase [Frankiales bacterium]